MRCLVKSALYFCEVSSTIKFTVLVHTSYITITHFNVFTVKETILLFLVFLSPMLI